MLQNSVVGKIVAGLTLGLVLTVAIVLIPAHARPMITVSGQEDSAPYEDVARVRGADFYFQDHELKYAGGYGLSPAKAIVTGADFDFIDHELRYAGAYGLRPAARCSSR